MALGTSRGAAQTPRYGGWRGDSPGGTHLLRRQISDAVVDAALAGDAASRVACETLLTTGLIVVAGEITSASVINYASLAREVVCDIGYDNGE